MGFAPNPTCTFAVWLHHITILILFNYGELCSFIIFFDIHVATHMTAHDVHVIQRSQCM